MAKHIILGAIATFVLLIAFNTGRLDASQRLALRSACDLEETQRSHLKAAWYGENR